MYVGILNMFRFPDVLFFLLNIFFFAESPERKHDQTYKMLKHIYEMQTRNVETNDREVKVVCRFEYSGGIDNLFGDLI